LPPLLRPVVSSVRSWDRSSPPTMARRASAWRRCSLWAHCAFLRPAVDSPRLRWRAHLTGCLLGECCSGQMPYADASVVRVACVCRLGPRHNLLILLVRADVPAHALRRGWWGCWPWRARGVTSQHTDRQSAERGRTSPCRRAPWNVPSPALSRRRRPRDPWPVSSEPPMTALSVKR
jgi:hypothetical protein